MTDNIYTLIPKIMAEVTSIGKNKKNQAQGYSFRGIDDVYAALQKPLAEHGVFFIPEIESFIREEKTSKNGGLLTCTIIKAKFTFYAPDGSHVTASTLGESMDSADKSANKAMSAALKYALLQTFCIPTEELKDSEHDNPEPMAKRSSATSSPKQQPDQITPSSATGNDVFAFFKATTANGWTRAQAIKLLVDTYEDAGITSENWTNKATVEMLEGIKSVTAKTSAEQSSGV